jgi:MoaA/NifB/PqqE/SkfB family radical SAM enzyme
MNDWATQAREHLDFIWLEITGRCNLECVHCYADSGPARPLSEGMELEDWMGALDEAARLGCKRVQFIGGEPTLHPGLPRLIEHARAAGYEEVCVYTNGTRFTDALKAAFVVHGVSLAFSVYGSNGEVHDPIAQRRGSFEKTHRAIRWAVEAGLAVRAGVVEMAANAHDMPGTRRMLEEAGVREVNVDRLRGLGRGSAERPGEPQLKELCGRCGSGKVCVSSSGEIYPCVFARFAPLGHLREGGLAAAFAGAPLRRFREALIDSYGGPAGERAAPDRVHVSCSPEMPAGDCNPEKPAGDCNPEKPAGDCNPEKPAGKCNPEIPPGPCIPEQPSWARPYVASGCSPEEPAPPCSPEKTPPDCNPEKRPPDCNPEKPSKCSPEVTAYNRFESNRLQ